MNPQDQLKEFLVDFFSPIDNIPEDTVRREQICMEARASLLIEANCTSEYFPAFMKSGVPGSNCWIYKFSQPWSCKCLHHFNNNYKLSWSFKEFEIGTPSINWNWHSANTWRLKIDMKSSANLNIINEFDPPFNYVQLIDWENSDAPRLSNNILKADFEQVNSYFQQVYRSRFQLCSQISPYKTPEQVCRFFGNRGEVFAKLKSDSMRPDCFLKNLDQTVPKRSDQADWSEARIEQEMFLEILPCSPQGASLLPLCHKYNGWFCQVFPFKDEFDEIRMQLIKLYMPKTQTKCLVPVTTWIRENYPYNQYFCVPLPKDKQPLYNLDLLLKPETETVILIDSVELADSNQRNAFDGIVFTSFICSPEHYEQVDWTPLKNKTIYYLITNHSGVSLESAALKARKLKEYLNKEEPEIKLLFVTLPVDYKLEGHLGRSRTFKNVDDILQNYEEWPPVVKTTEIKFWESDEEFLEFCAEAEEIIKSHNIIKPPTLAEITKYSQQEEIFFSEWMPRPSE